jgi:hypothetical protein
MYSIKCMTLPEAVIRSVLSKNRLSSKTNLYICVSILAAPLSVKAIVVRLFSVKLEHREGMHRTAKELCSALLFCCASTAIVELSIRAQHHKMYA